MLKSTDPIEAMGIIHQVITEEDPTNFWVKKFSSIIFTKQTFIGVLDNWGLIGPEDKKDIVRHGFCDEIYIYI